MSRPGAGILFLAVVAPVILGGCLGEAGGEVRWAYLESYPAVEWDPITGLLRVEGRGELTADPMTMPTFEVGLYRTKCPTTGGGAPASAPVERSVRSFEVQENERLHQEVSFSFAAVFALKDSFAVTTQAFDARGMLDGHRTCHSATAEPTLPA